MHYILEFSFVIFLCIGRVVCCARWRGSDVPRHAGCAAPLLQWAACIAVQCGRRALGRCRAARSAFVTRAACHTS